MWKPQLQVELLEFCHIHGTDNPKYLQKQKIRKTENVKICHTSSVYHPPPPPHPRRHLHTHTHHHHHHPLRAYQLLVGYERLWKGELWTVFMHNLFDCWEKRWKIHVSNNYLQIKNVCRPKKLYEFLWMNESEICARKPIKWNLFRDTFMNYLVFIILENK